MPNRPKGTLIQKIARQSTSARMPPTTSPTNEPAMPATMLIPIAMPRLAAGKASVRIAVELAISSAPPMPWTTRQAISQIAPPAPSIGHRLRAIEANVKTAKPPLYILTRPNMSPRRPNVTTSTAVTTR